MIKVCMFSKYHDDITDFLKQNNIAYESEECLLRCDLCHTVPFIKFDKGFISNEDITKLFEEIKSSII